MTEAEFRALAAQGYNRIPLVLETFADLDTPLSLYVKLANAPLHVPARVGRRRRALRPLLVHRPARADRASARAAPRSRSTIAATIVERHDGDPLAFVGDVHAPLPRGAAPGSAALLRRARRLSSATTRCATSSRSSRPRRRRRRRSRRRPRHPAAADRGARGRRQSRRQDLAHRLRRSRRARCVREGDGAPAGAAPASCASRSSIPFQTATAVDARPRANSAPTASRRPCARAKEYIAAGDIMQVVLSQRHAPAVHVVAAVALPRAALAQSVAVHVLLRLRRLPRRRRVAGNPRAQGRHDGHAAPDRRHAPARRDARRRRQARRRSCSPIRRNSPST